MADSSSAWQKSCPIPPGRRGHFPVSQTTLLADHVLKVVNRWSLSFLGLEKKRLTSYKEIQKYLLSTGGEVGATRALVANKGTGDSIHHPQAEQVLVGQVPSSHLVPQLDSHRLAPRHLGHHPKVALAPVPGLLASREGLAREELATSRIEEGLARNLGPELSHRGRSTEGQEPSSAAIRVTRSTHSTLSLEWISLRLEQVMLT